MIPREEYSRKAELERLKQIRSQVDSGMQRFIDDRIRELEQEKGGNLRLPKGGSL
jgi:hypothetical protein